MSDEIKPFEINKYEAACIIWFQGCTCSEKNHPETCWECTEGFRSRIISLIRKDHPEELNKGVI